MSSTQTNKALVATNQPDLVIKDLPKPKPGQHEVLVRITHAAQNPTDVQSFDRQIFGAGAVYGCDFVGEVVELGQNVKRVGSGDVVAGLIWGGEMPNLGAFSHYAIANEDICFKVPPGAKREGAATVPLAATTAWLALFSSDCLKMPRGRPNTVLIWGGSSSVGQYAIQLAKLESLKVVATCSPKNFELVKSLGADHIFDYNARGVVDQIKAAVPDLEYIFDTIGSTGSPASSDLAAQAVKGDGRLTTVRPGRANTEKVPSRIKITDVLVWTAFLTEHRFGDNVWPISEEDNKLASELFERMPDLLSSGQLKTNAVVRLQGLEAVKEGYQMHRDGKLSAQKIVYEISN